MEQMAKLCKPMDQEFLIGQLSVDLELLLRLLLPPQSQGEQSQEQEQSASPKQADRARWLFISRKLDYIQ